MNQFSFTDDDLRRAVNRADEILLHQYDSLKDYTYTFSDEFKEKMAALIRSIKRRRQRMTAVKRIAAVFAALLVSIGTWLTFDVDARAAVCEWVKEVYEDFIAYKYWGEVQPDVLPQYELTWMPEGFVEVDGTYGEDFSSIVYMDLETNDIIIFEYKFTNSDNYVGIQESTENVQYEKIDIQGNSAELYYVSEISDTNTIIWSNNLTNVTFLVNSTLNQNEIIRIAENVTLAES